jgi:dTDP-4-dehydrorhamnose reductase
MKILVIGASGLIGWNCLRYLARYGYSVKGTHYRFATDKTVYFNASDLNDSSNSQLVQFDIIIHCGALTNVDFCEHNPADSYRETVLSAKNVVCLAKQFGAKIIYISTDYVFDGAAGPYVEEDPVSPINIYGRHKLEAENVVLEHSLENLIFRVTNVYGEEIRGKNFIARIVNAISNNEFLDLCLPSDQFATPVNAYDIARGIHRLLQSNSFGIYHFGATDYYSRVQLFRKILEYFPNFEKFRLKVLPTKEIDQPAARPLLGGLLSRKFISQNQDFEFSNVDKYLKQINFTKRGI